MSDISESSLPVVSSIGDGDYIRTVYNDSGTMTSALVSKEDLIPSAAAYILITDTKAAASDGGTFTAGSYVTRTLNTENVDTGNNASLASDQITLSAGTYRIQISVPAVSVNGHKAQLYNVTDAATALTGTSEYSISSSTVMTRSVIVGRITIATSKVFEVRHRCTTTKTTNGFGIAANFVLDEVYTIFEAWKE